MSGRPAGLTAEPPQPAPVPAPAISPRDALGQHYADQMLLAFRALHAVTGELADHLERGGDPAAFMARAAEFDALVRAVGAAMLSLGHLLCSDGTA